MSAAPLGALVAIGGKEDKLDEKNILARTLGAVHGEARNVVVIGAASREPGPAQRPYLRAFERLGIEKVRTLSLQHRRDIEEERTLERLREADVIYFTGGDQVRLVDAFRGSEALELVRERYERGAVIAGTSAGAVAMSEVMIARGESHEGLTKGNVKFGEGLGLLPGTIIDSHFLQRGRMARLVEAVTHKPDLLGLGLSEDTGVIVREGRYCEVVGSDTVIVVDGREIKRSNKDEARDGEPLTVERAIVHALAEGSWFDIETRAWIEPRGGPRAPRGLEAERER